MWAAEAPQQQDAGKKGEGKDEAWSISHSDSGDGGISTTGAPSHARERGAAMISPSRLITTRQPPARLQRSAVMMCNHTNVTSE